MPTKPKALLLFAATSALSLSLVILAASTLKTSTFSIAESIGGDVTFSSSDLKTIALEDIKLKGDSKPADKKFRLPLGNGKYIEGAIVFNDCGYQYTGATLGDFFGINNTDTIANAYNFNILFSMENTERITVNYSLRSGTNDGSVCSYFEMKYSNEFGGDGFYEGLETHYNRVKEKHSQSSSLYTGEYSGLPLTLDGSSTKVGDIYSKTHVGACEQPGYKIAAFQCTYEVEDNEPADKYFVQAGQKIEFAINSLEIKYRCN